MNLQKFLLEAVNTERDRKYKFRKPIPIGYSRQNNIFLFISHIRAITGLCQIILKVIYHSVFSILIQPISYQTVHSTNLPSN